MKTQPPKLVALGFLLAALPLAPAASAHAQEGDGFLFRPPVMSLGFSVGYAMPRTESEIFDFTRQQLTVGEGAFDAFTLRIELAVRVNERLDVAVGGGWSDGNVRSEFHDWVGSDGLPIEQTSRLARLPLTLGVKGYLVDRGRRLGQFAWVPARVAPYLGAGVGAMWYAFEQEGEFVDHETLDIFFERYGSEGWAPTAHLLGGMDLTLIPRVALTAEGRYSWASRELGRDFVGFDDIDLAGLQATLGLTLRF